MATNTELSQVRQVIFMALGAHTGVVGLASDKYF